MLSPSFIKLEYGYSFNGIDFYTLDCILSFMVIGY